MSLTQRLATPFFFSYATTLEHAGRSIQTTGAPPSDWSPATDKITAQLAQDLLPVMRDSFIAWVPLNTINFYFTPPQFRVVFLSAAQACWLVYLSLVQHKR
mmetsp:Transcript_31033/g.82284  ORF Transcript_31033/g.82284 Transcript_31033/m.82284 type:complete len:101 (+) Transcript_31033:254-556(+)